IVRLLVGSRPFARVRSNALGQRVGRPNAGSSADTPQSWEFGMMFPEPRRKKASKRFPFIRARTGKGLDFLGTGLLDHGFEVRLRRLQSIMVRPSSRHFW